MVVAFGCFPSRFCVYALNCPHKLKTPGEQEQRLLFALMFPTGLSALHTVGAPELSLTDGCNESLNSFMNQWATEWCNHTTDCLDFQVPGRKPKPTQAVVMVL